jgi:membrane protease YdiL (CAAX protease family)
MESSGSPSSPLPARWPLATFVLLACAFTWALLPFARISIVFSLIALLGPAFAAWVVATRSGRKAVEDLRARILEWRVPRAWIATALLLPIPVTALRSAIEWVAGAEGPIRPLPWTPLGLAVFVLVAGEEIGWRGFALPRWLERTGPWRASLAVGLVWALWHLPLFAMPGMPQFGTPFVAYVPYLVALSAILTVLARETRGSVLVATLFHGAVNTFGFTNLAASAELRGWTNAASYGLCAVTLALARRRRGGSS